MLLAPTIALGLPSTFQYNRAHSLFWVVRATQLTRLRREAERASRPPGDAQVACFHCRQLEPVHDRQPITSRTAALTRASGERLARTWGADVSGAAVWWRLAAEVLPQQVASFVRIYRRMPKVSPTKLRLL